MVGFVDLTAKHGGDKVLLTLARQKRFAPSSRESKDEDGFSLVRAQRFVNSLRWISPLTQKRRFRFYAYLLIFFSTVRRAFYQQPFRL